MNPKWPGGRQHRVMPHSAQNFICLHLVVVNSCPISPAVHRKIKSHHVILFPVRRGPRGPRRTVRAHRPGEVTHRRIVLIGDQHVRI
jgi:hypothetical protein